MRILISYLAIYQVFLILYLFIELFACFRTLISAFVLKKAIFINFCTFILLIVVSFFHILCFKIALVSFQLLSRILKMYFFLSS